MSDTLSKWALPRLARLLPLDDESLQEIITYTASLSKEAGADHLRNILGDTSAALEFISSFNSRREDVKPAPSTTSQSHTPQHTDSEGIPSTRRRGPKKSRAPLHNAGPVRQPEGYGDVTGAYRKTYDNESYVPGARASVPSATALSNALSLSQEPVALQVPQVSQRSTGSPQISRDPSPAYGRQKLPPSAAGNLISDLPNVRSKQSKKPGHAVHSGTSTPRHGGTTTTTTSNVQDLTAAIAALEIATNPSLSSERRKCDCNASIHPLFETAPNCLSCGKIICALEGLQPCSYCDAPVLSKAQVDNMIRALKDERGVERMASHNAGVASGRGTPMFGGSTPESSSGDEASSAAARARAHRDKLLSFQRENAQRTRVHDEAADYDTTLTPGATQWMSPLQRAAALKRHQKYMRELQEASRPEWEKKRTVMSMSIKNGKLVRTYGREKTPVAEHEHELGVDHDEDPTLDRSAGHDDVQARDKSKGSGAFSKNPLLSDGKLVRPLWKPKDGTDASAPDQSPASSSTRIRKEVWRKVQDDNEDNEQWILDGGLLGHNKESRVMEDGSQQECG